jgi:hypothetical protein
MGVDVDKPVPCDLHIVNFHIPRLHVKIIAFLELIMMK